MAVGFFPSLEITYLLEYQQIVLAALFQPQFLVSFPRIQFLETIEIPNKRLLSLLLRKPASTPREKQNKSYTYHLLCYCYIERL